MATRRILAIIIALVLLLGGIVCLAGCSSSSEEEEKEEIEYPERETLLVVKSHDFDYVDGSLIHQYIYYDPDTLVMYVMISHNNGISMSVLYNADGTPKLYNPENN